MMFLILLFLSLGYSTNVLPNGGNGFFHLSRLQGTSEFCQLLPTGEVPVTVLNNKLTLNVNQGPFQGEISGDYNDNIFAASRNVTTPPPCGVASVSFTVNTTSLTQGFGKISAHCLVVAVSCDFEVNISGFSSSPTAPPTLAPTSSPTQATDIISKLQEYAAIGYHLLITIYFVILLVFIIIVGMKCFSPMGKVELTDVGDHEDNDNNSFGSSYDGDDNLSISSDS